MKIKTLVLPILAAVVCLPYSFSADFDPGVVVDHYSTPHEIGAEISDIAVCPSGDIFATGYVHNGSKRHWLIRKSSDHGQTWKTVDYYSAGDNAEARKILCTPNNDVYAGGALWIPTWEQPGIPKDLWGIRRSRDGGRSWETIDHFHGWFGDMAVSLSGDIFISGAISADEWITRRSTDGGKTFFTVDHFREAGEDVDTRGTAIAFDPLGTVFVLGIESRSLTLRWSEDNGNTWETSRIALGWWEATGFAILPNGHWLALADESAGVRVLLSENQGRTWKLRDTGGGTCSPKYSYSKDLNVGDQVVSYWLLCNDGMTSAIRRVSYDQGKTWTDDQIIPAQSTGLEQTWEIAVAQDGSLIFGGGENRSKSAKSYWMIARLASDGTPKLVDNPRSEARSTSPRHITAVGPDIYVAGWDWTDGILRRTRDGGLTWEEVTRVIDGSIFHVVASSAGVLYLADCARDVDDQQRCRIRMSKDEGKTWATIRTENNRTGWGGSDMKTSPEGELLLVYWNKILRWSEQTSRWDEIPPPRERFHPTALGVGPRGEIIVAGDLYVGSNEITGIAWSPGWGNPWTITTLETQPTSSDIVFDVSGVPYLLMHESNYSKASSRFDHYRIYRSFDQSQSWEMVKEFTGEMYMADKPRMISSPKGLLTLLPFRGGWSLFQQEPGSSEFAEINHYRLSEPYFSFPIGLAYASDGTLYTTGSGDDQHGTHLIVRKHQKNRR